MTTSRRGRTILVHEWVTGGGLADSILPCSWAAEGRAMRRAIARDFAAADDGRHRVIVTLDARLDREDGPWTLTRMAPADYPGRLIDLAREADFTLLIAPETTGILESLTRELEQNGTRLLGSTAEAIALTADKSILAGHLATRGIDTPRCRVVLPRQGLPLDAEYPAVLKPIDGAGSLETFLVESAGRLPESARDMDRALLQPYISGTSMSASFLIDPAGRAWLLGIGEQAIQVEAGRFVYRGGRLPTTATLDERRIRRAVESVPGLRGFVGVDFLRDDRLGRITVLEVNPRPTTSIVGLLHLLPPGRLAAAWLAAFDSDSSSLGLLPSLAELLRDQPPIEFDPSGNVFAAGEGHEPSRDR